MVYRCEEVLLSYNKFSETKDQWESISLHTGKGICFLETYSQFVKERCQAELEYAKSLRKIVKSFIPKKKDDDELSFSFVRAFRDAVRETGDIAGQHEVVAEELTRAVVTEISNLVRMLKEERKKNISEGMRVQQQLTQQIAQLEKAKRNYEKAFREAEKAQENFVKADADLHLSRAEVEKQRMNAMLKNQQCEDSKNEYANQLQKTNQLQSEHYNTVMPSIFQSMQEMDERRINSFRSLLKTSVETERAVYPILNKCLDGIVQAADSIDETQDSSIVIEKYKSGFCPPGDIPFDDLSTPRQNGNSTPSSHLPTRNDTIKGTLSASRLRKRAGIFNIFSTNKNNVSFSEKDDFSDLPPNQRKKKIQQKMDDIKTKLNQETGARDGLLKMKEVYEGNPSLGDPMTITGQLTDSYQRIEKLKAELDKYQLMLDEVDQENQNIGNNSSITSNSNSLDRFTSSAAMQNGSSPRSSLTSHRTSISDESLSRSASDSSVCTNPLPPSYQNVTGRGGSQAQQNALQQISSSSPSVLSSTSTTVVSSTTRAPLSNSGTSSVGAIQGASNSPESGIGLSHNSLPGTEDTYDRPDGHYDDTEDFCDPELLPVIGTCKALYTFEGTSEGSMAMAEGESLYIIEHDQGDGWTRVRRVNVFEEGFVPTTYIECTPLTNRV